MKFYGGPAGPPDFIFGGPEGFWALKDPLGPAGPPIFPTLFIKIFCYPRGHLTLRYTQRCFQPIIVSARADSQVHKQARNDSIVNSRTLQ